MLRSGICHPSYVYWVTEIFNSHFWHTEHSLPFLFQSSQELAGLSHLLCGNYGPFSTGTVPWWPKCLSATHLQRARSLKSKSYAGVLVAEGEGYQHLQRPQSPRSRAPGDGVKAHAACWPSTGRQWIKGQKYLRHCTGIWVSVEWHYS